MAAKEVPRIRSGMQDPKAPLVEAWSDDDYRRATSLGTILSPDGKADRAGVPALAPAVLRHCYLTMLRLRALGDRTQALVETGGLEPVPPTRGHEAAITGAVAALEAHDVVAPGRRGVGAALWRGHTLAAFAAGTPIPRALGVLPATPFTATQLPHATGIAWAMKLQPRAGAPAAVALAYLDREATSAEDFHSGLNFAGVFQVPAVFVCVDDAAGVKPPVETVSETLAVKALAYGVAATRVDGADLFAVYAATRAAADRARRGEGASLIEAVVSESADPLERVRVWLAGQTIVDGAADAALRREVAAEAAAAFGPG
jgi:pyruvate dehydrogenase E1 component alpha subunit